MENNIYYYVQPQVLIYFKELLSSRGKCLSMIRVAPVERSRATVITCNELIVSST